MQGSICACLVKTTGLKDKGGTVEVPSQVSRTASINGVERVPSGGVGHGRPQQEILRSSARCRHFVRYFIGHGEPPVSEGFVLWKQSSFKLWQQCRKLSEPGSSTVCFLGL